MDILIARLFLYAKHSLCIITSGLFDSLTNDRIMIANGATFEEILADYEYLEAEDIKQALKYASWTMSKF